MAWVFLFWGVFLALVALERPAAAADLVLKAPAAMPAFDWTGFYIGAHTLYSRGSSGAVLWDPVPTAMSGNVSGMIGGVQAGYNWRLPSGLLLGAGCRRSWPLLEKLAWSITSSHS